MRSFQDGFKALVVGASGGIGGAVLSALRNEQACAAAVGLSRSVNAGFDLTDEVSIRVAAERLQAEHGMFDLIFDATGGLEIGGVGPEKTIRTIDPDAMARQFALNAIGPALLLKHFSPLMPRGRRAVFASLSARVGSIGDNRLGGWISYRAAKAALNQIVRTAAIEINRSNGQAVVVALHPGTVATALSAKFAADRDVFSPEFAARRLLAVIDKLAATDTGGFFAYDGSAIDW
ncbi:SDR family NAD(P)-dependent oxidoreductase [Pararhizobium sp.]|uniref:SDR family NAD(P)-dependent oxidoreductase n=1 Tax=Pararhizobium sp. TaxID=1977563 RepID=UPI002726D350|nr:SDR family NAD(P)-dependent oxidoreductase [Pararhizobium sp.]MDO9414949.1 SDR family NAD(P)-dependent oxidoreductase [Pararhizobium sp.]